MTTRKPFADLSMMTHVPLQPIWLARLPAFQSSDARIVRGCLNMLMAAFHGQPAGTLPNTPEALATTAQITFELAFENYQLLTSGWRVGKDSMSFEPMVQMAQRLSSDYSEALQRLQDGVVVAIAAPDLFNTELLPEQGSNLAAKIGGATQLKAETALADTKVKRRLPSDTFYTPMMAEHMIAKGFPANLHSEIWEMFADYHRSRQTTSASWESEFRNWLMNQIRFGKLVPAIGDVPDVFRPAMTSGPIAAGVPMGTKTSFSFTRPGQIVSDVRGESRERNAANNLEAAKRAVASLRNARPGQG